MDTRDIKKVVDLGITAVLNNAADNMATGAGELAWTLDASFSALLLTGSAVGLYTEDEVVDVLGAWQRFLDMEVVDPPAVPGTLQFRTEREGLTVTVMGVIDEDRFRADARAFEMGQREAAAHGV